MDNDNTGAISATDYRAIRDQIGLTQEQLAWELGVSTSTIQKRERGAVKIDQEAVTAIRMVAEKVAARTA